MLPGPIWAFNCPPAEASASPVSSFIFQPLSNFIEISPTQICDCKPSGKQDLQFPPLEQMFWTPAGRHCYALKPSNNRCETRFRYNANPRYTRYHRLYRHDLPQKFSETVPFFATVGKITLKRISSPLTAINFSDGTKTMLAISSDPCRSLMATSSSPATRYEWFYSRSCNCRVHGSNWRDR